MRFQTFRSLSDSLHFALLYRCMWVEFNDRFCPVWWYIERFGREHYCVDEIRSFVGTVGADCIVHYVPCDCPDDAKQRIRRKAKQEAIRPQELREFDVKDVKLQYRYGQTYRPRQIQQPNAFEENQMNVDETFGGKWLTGAACAKKPFVGIVSHVGQEHRHGETKYYVEFEDGTRMNLNKSNSIAISKVLGPETDDWVNAQLKVASKQVFNPQSGEVGPGCCVVAVKGSKPTKAIDAKEDDAEGRF